MTNGRVRKLFNSKYFYVKIIVREIFPNYGIRSGSYIHDSRWCSKYVTQYFHPSCCSEFLVATPMHNLVAMPTYDLVPALWHSSHKKNGVGVCGHAKSSTVNWTRHPCFVSISLESYFPCKMCPLCWHITWHNSHDGIMIQPHWPGVSTELLYLL